MPPKATVSCSETAQQTGPSQADFTFRLIAIRTRKGITLEVIADETKISLRSLRAIEAGEFHKLPGGVYDISYIRQYARAIDFEESELIAHYHAITGRHPASELTETPPASRTKKPILRFLRHPYTATGS